MFIPVSWLDLNPFQFQTHSHKCIIEKENHFELQFLKGQNTILHCLPEHQINITIDPKSTQC